MENWKLAFRRDDRTVCTAGEMGKVVCYNVDSAEETLKKETTDIFATAIATVNFKITFIN